MNRKRLRILIITPFFSPNIGGVETHLTDLTKCLNERNFRVFVITYTPLTTKVKNVLLREAKGNLEIHRVKWLGRGLFLRLEPYFIFEFLYLFPALFLYTFIFMRMKKVDIIHAHGLVAASITMILSKFFKVRTVMSIHGIYQLRGRPTLKRVVWLTLLPFDAILSLSEKSKKDFMEAGIPENKISIYTHWVDQTCFKPPQDKEELKRKLGLNDNFVVLFVGRLLETKGVGVLLEVAKRCPNNVKFLFIGTGSMEKTVKKASRQQANVAFIGTVPVDELVNYYGAADLVTVPSQHEEGFARVILEALSCGTPIIAVNKGCPPEMIDSSVGVLTNPTPRELSRFILYFYENQGELQRIASNCRAYAEGKYSERNAVIIERAYKADRQ